MDDDDGAFRVLRDLLAYRAEQQPGEPTSASGADTTTITTPRMRGRVVEAVLAGGAVAAGVTLARRYRRDLDAAGAQLAAVVRKVVPTAFGDVEYAERGSGEPLLVVHGIFHGCDGGLLSAGDLPQDRRLIAPSRFGYLGSTLPSGATPADQADAFAALLDELALDRVDVVGISAGTTSALQFSLRHPDRIGHLVVISGNLPGNPTAVAPPAWARLLYADVPLWAMKVFARRAFLRLMGVPKDLPLTGEAAAFVDDMANSIFPVAPRAEGATFDAFVSNPDVNDYPLEQIAVPTLVVHAQDDPLTSYDAAVRAAKRIPHRDSCPSPRAATYSSARTTRSASRSASSSAQPATSSNNGVREGEQSDRAQPPGTLSV